MLKIYSILGGGSTNICKKLREKFKSSNCFCRIDKFFLAPDESQVLDDKSFFNKKKAQKYKNHQVVSNFEEFPKQSVIDAIAKRTKFKMNPEVSINKNLSTLISSNPKKYFVLVRSPEFKFLSANNIRSIAIVRHPLFGYVGLCNPKRHPEFVAPDGLQTKQKVRWFAGLWNRSVEDFLDSNSVILRYEFINQDIKNKKEVDASVFSEWNPSLRPSNLRKNLENLLLELVKDNYFKLYKSWDLTE